MPGNPHIRASDADRDRAAELLREHHAAGRLTVEEFNERLEAAFAAKTLGDIDALFTDLPSIDLYRLPDASLRRQPPSGRLPASGMGGGQSRGPGTRGPGNRGGLGGPSGGLGGLASGGPGGGHPPATTSGGIMPSTVAAWGTWAALNTIMFAIWVTSLVANGGTWFPWFLFIAIPSTLGVLRRTRRYP